jgi:acyl carrier protein
MTTRTDTVISQHVEPDVRDLVLTALALACRADRATLRGSTRLHDLAVDSLTLVAVLARIEASCSVELTADDMLALFAARDVAAFIRAVEDLVAHARARGSN